MSRLHVLGLTRRHLRPWSGDVAASAMTRHPPGSASRGENTNLCSRVAIGKTRTLWREG